MGVVFFLFWIVLNGRVTFEIVIFGLFISLFVYLFSCRFLDYDPKAEIRFAARIPLALILLVILVKEIVKATLTMIGFIFNFRDIPEPCVVHFRTPLKSDLAQYALATFITLTPGTITVRLRDEEFQVHCYDREMAGGIDESVFVKYLMKMEGSRK